MRGGPAVARIDGDRRVSTARSVGAHVTNEIDVAVDALRQDRVVVYPTETFYGLGANALHRAAVRACADLKGRDTRQPIAVIVADVAMVTAVVAEVSRDAARLMERFWPGALTLVLPAREGLAPELTAGSGTIGVRVSSHPIATALASRLGAPITATSANRSGEPPNVEIAPVRDAFGAAVAAYVDGGSLAGGLASTVVVLADDVARVVRPGAVSIEALRDVLGPTAIR